MVQINLKSKYSKAKIAKLPTSIEIKANDPVQLLLDGISKATGLSTNRIRLTIPDANSKPAKEGSKKKPADTVLDGANPILTYSQLAPELDVYVKDLGPQISWLTVFQIEYLGPILIHPLFYFGQSFIYHETFSHSKPQQLTLIFSLLHFLKREYETAYVHKFSLDTMPLRNLFKNSSHYWLLSGVLLSYFNYAPPSYSDSSAPFIKRLLFSNNIFPLSENTLYALSGLWLFAELSNFWTHLTLASLRSDGSKEHKIPRGYGFNLVSVPNYFFEYLSWLAVVLITQNWSSVLFLVVSTAQMWVWAVKKHRRYRKEFGDKYPRSRKIMFPFLF